jgi:DNA-binding XRE family transcriptional regulator
MTLEHTSPEPGVVLAKAAVRAAEQLGLKRAQLAIVLGVDEAAIGLIEQNPGIDPASRGGESCLLLVQLADGLSALAGDDKD